MNVPISSIWLIGLVLVAFVGLLLVLFFGIVAAIFGNESDLNSDLLEDGEDYVRKDAGRERR